jgi:hypothetical protein
MPKPTKLPRAPDKCVSVYISLEKQLEGVSAIRLQNSLFCNMKLLHFSITYFISEYGRAQKMNWIHKFTANIN